MAITATIAVSHPHPSISRVHLRGNGGTANGPMLTATLESLAGFLFPFRLRSPVEQKYEAVLGESDGECMANGQKTTSRPPLRRGRRVSGSPEEFDPGRGIGVPTRRSRAALLIW